MKIYGATKEDILLAARDIDGVAVTRCSKMEGGGWNVTIKRTTDNLWVKKEDIYHNPTTNKIERYPDAVCWHGHTAFIHAILKRTPRATIGTSIAKYRGLVDFEARHRSKFKPTGECSCEEVKTFTGAKPEPNLETTSGFRWLLKKLK